MLKGLPAKATGSAAYVSYDPQPANIAGDDRIGQTIK